MADQKPADKAVTPPPEPAKFVPIKVRATRPGTYPDALGGRPRYRDAGAEFVVYAEEHLSLDDGKPDSLGWMVQASIPKGPGPDLNMPITTAQNVVKDPMAIFQQR
jgi:hypothetical protein